MSKIPIRRGFAVALIAGVAIACAPAAASVAPTGTPAPSIAVAPSAAPSGPSPSPSAVPAAATASPLNVPAVLAVACDGVRTTLATPVVRAQPDGVHVRFENSSGNGQPFTIEDVGGSEVPAEGGSFTYLFGPGRYRLSCAGDLVGFEVVDPAGFYRPAACADTGSGTIGTNDYVEGATGMRGTVLEVARRQLGGLAPGDSVERGGYPLAEVSPVVVVVRHGVILAVLSYSGDGHGGWLLDTMRTCAGAGITIVS